MKEANFQSTRRSLAYVSILGTVQLHLRSPFIIALWSVVFPGAGQILLCNYLRGYLLFFWEIFVNYKANINLLILYSFMGDFEKAKNIVDIDWLLLYIPMYVYAVWDSYRSTIDLNHNYILAAREDAEIKPFNMNALETNYLDRRTPWVAAAWSALIPGSGQLYAHKIINAFFFIVWWVALVYLSKVLPAFHYTILGDFQMAKSVLDMHWFLNIPSIYLFGIYSSYENSVENNKLYDWEQGKFLKKHYRNHNFKIPKLNNTGDSMYLISTFEHSKYLELAITAIEMKGIKKENILAVPLDKRNENRALFDSIHGADGISLLDIPAILAVFFGIFGCIYGFILKWGPLLCGLIAMVLGLVFGLIIKYFTSKKYYNNQGRLKGTEVVLIIECAETQLEMVKDTLWAHYAFGVSKVDLNQN